MTKNIIFLFLIIQKIESNTTTNVSINKDLEDYKDVVSNFVTKNINGY